MDEPGGITQNFLRHGRGVHLRGAGSGPVARGARARAAEASLARSGAALAYGQVEGPPGLRHALARRITAREHVAATAADVLVTGGNSQGLEQVLTVFSEPGDVVLVESPTYNLALGIVRDHPVDIVGVPLDADGLDVAALEARLEEFASAGRRARLLYTIPTYHNPTGICLSARDASASSSWPGVTTDRGRGRRLPRARVRGLRAAVALAMDREAPVIRLGSFSKTLAPGLRVGWANARADLLQRLAGMGMLESGGGVSYFARTWSSRCWPRRATTSTWSCCAGSTRGAATRSPPRCKSASPPGAASPSGGRLLRVARTPGGGDAAALLPLAEARGVSFAPGARFCLEGGELRLRLAFSLYGEDALREGARRLAAALAAMPA